MCTYDSTFLKSSRKKKPVYSLKQTTRVGYQKLSYSLIDLGFTKAMLDFFMFFQHTSRKAAIVLVYVNNIIVTNSCDSCIIKLVRLLNEKFSLKDLGQLHLFFRIEVQRKNVNLHHSQ